MLTISLHNWQNNLQGKRLLPLFLITLRLLFGCPSSLYGQSPRQDIKFFNLDMAQGLTQNRVNCVIQCRKGFLWFGTAQGLHRYDGYQFKVYQNELNNLNSLSNNYILTLYEDSQGYIWIGTFGGGANRFNPDTEEFTRFQVTPDNPRSIGGKNVRAFYEDKDGKLWMGITNGFFCYFDLKQQKFQRFEKSYHLYQESLTYVYCIINDQDKGFWLGTAQGLAYFDKQQQVVSKLFNNKNKRVSHRQQAVFCVVRDRIQSHILWLCTYHQGLVKFDTHQQRVIGQWKADFGAKQALQTNSVWSFHQDSQGNHWVGTKKGFYKFIPQTGQFILFTPNPQNSRSIAGYYIQHIFEDRAGTIWLCSFDRGISAFTPKLHNFIHYTPATPHISQITSFCEDKERNLWIGVSGSTTGLFKFDRANQTFQAFKPTPDTSHSIASPEANALLTDIDGSIWIGTLGKGLDHYDPKTGKFEHYPPYLDIPENASKIYFRNPHIGALYQAPQQADKLWVGTRGSGLFQLDKQTKKFTKQYYIDRSYNKTKLSQPTIIAIAQDYKGNLWLATRGGLNRLDLQKDTFTNYLHSPKDSNSISGNYVTTLHADTQQVLWIGTRNGLNKLSLKEVYQGKVNFRHYTTQQGLAHNTIKKIIEDAQGFLWISTSNGLCRFDKKREVFRCFYEQYGLQSNEFMTGSGLLLHDGAILMGGNNGFNWFYPHKIKTNTYAPPVVFTDFRLFNQPVPVKKKGKLTLPIWATDTIQLSHRDNLFSFGFAALNYISPHQNTYAVWMENFDETWQPIGTQHEKTYLDLPTGTYVLRVKAANNDGIWSKKEARMVIIIAPPWWQTQWFKAMIVLLIGGLCMVGHYAWQYFIKIQQKRLTETLYQHFADQLNSNATLSDQKKVNQSEEHPTSRSNFKDKAEVEQLKQKLHEVIVLDGLFKEEEISLNKIAKKMGITDKKLSELFNKELDSNFYEYINICRINAFKKMIKEGEAKHKTLLAIAYESGFMSKATFNRMFKKHTQLTPSKFKKQIEEETKNNET